MIEHISRSETPHRILLIEDDPAYARLVEALLSESGHLHCSITHRKTLREGIELLIRGERFAAVLLDLSLPDSQGFDTLSRLAPRFPNLNIIVLTGRDDKELGILAVKAGAQDFLVKGAFGDEQLGKALRYSIARNNVLKRLEETQRLARIGHWECNPHNHYFLASEEVYRIFGQNIHQPFTCEELMRPDCPFYLFMKIQQEAQREGKAQKDTWIERPDGGRRYLALVCTAIRLSNGDNCFNGIVQDITERKQAQELKKARDLAQHTARVREQFIASISHEMRTPMNAILGMASLLEQTPLNSEQDSYLQAIRQSSEVLLGIINDILQMSAINNNKLAFRSERFHLQELFDKLASVMKYKTLEKGLAFRLETSADVPLQLQGDVQQLNQILYNIVGNALKFTDEGHVRLSVRLLEETPGRAHLEFLVEDTGIGIEKDDLNAIFEAFSRIPKRERLYEGTGLGLPIAKSLVEGQGGKVWVESQVGKGSRFFFTLWFEKQEQQQVSEPAKKGLSLIPSDMAFRLLLVEDHQLNRLVARKALERKWARIDILTAENGEQALQILQREPVDIILMDVQMPVRDGFSTTEYIRQHMPPPACETPILAMTAHAHIALNEEFRRRGMDDYVLKPFEPEQLFQKIEYYLKK